MIFFCLNQSQCHYETKLPACLCFLKSLCPRAMSPIQIPTNQFGRRRWPAAQERDKKEQSQKKKSKVGYIANLNPVFLAHSRLDRRATTLIFCNSVFCVPYSI